MLNNPDIHIEEIEEVAIFDDILGGFAIILFNDEVNTFDHVIDCLMEYCGHNAEQAEQSANIVHYKGKCAVKHGGEKELKGICDALCRKSLSAVIEKI